MGKDLALGGRCPPYLWHIFVKSNRLLSDRSEICPQHLAFACAWIETLICAILEFFSVNSAWRGRLNLQPAITPIP